jgi:uncharacterized metal-binding protein YceD (DUF177 family)
MIIRISDLPTTGLEVKDKLPLPAFNERLSAGDSHGIVFTEGLDVQLTVYKSPSGAETKGNVKATYRQPCARCTDGVERSLELPINYILQPRPVTAAFKDSELYEDDIGITYYDGDHVNLEELIQETIILSLSIFWSPDENEKGDCSVCHKNIRANFNKTTEKTKGTSLGDLLKKAGV